MGTREDAGAPLDRWEWFSPSRGRVVTTEPKRRPPADAPDDWTLLTDGAAVTDVDPPPSGTRAPPIGDRALGSAHRPARPFGNALQPVK